MKPDLSPDDHEGLVLQAKRREQAREAERKRETPASLAGFWLPVAFIIALILVVMCVRWSLAK